MFRWIRSVAAHYGWLQKAALRGLKMWGTPENIPVIASVIENWFTHGEAVHALTQFKTPEAAVVLAKCLPAQGDRAFVSAALKNMGPIAEKAVIPYVNNKDGWAAQEACRILTGYRHRRVHPHPGSHG